MFLLDVFLWKVFFLHFGLKILQPNANFFYKMGYSDILEISCISSELSRGPLLSDHPSGNFLPFEDFGNFWKLNFSKKSWFKIYLETFRMEILGATIFQAMKKRIYYGYIKFLFFNIFSYFGYLVTNCSVYQSTRKIVTIKFGRLYDFSFRKSHSLKIKEDNT